MRLTVEVTPEHLDALASLASERGAGDVTELVVEAIDEYLRRKDDRDRRRERLLALQGSISHEDAEELRRVTTALRES
jgi:hypothetical protein